jgi:hypothetical protein
VIRIQLLIFEYTRYRREGNPESVRTSAFLVVPSRPSVAPKKAEVVLSGLLLLTSFVSSPFQGFGSLVRFFWRSKRNERIKFGRAKNEQIIFRQTHEWNFSLYVFHFKLINPALCALLILYPFPIPFPYSKGKGVLQYLLKTLNEKCFSLFTIRSSLFTYQLCALLSCTLSPTFFPNY